MGRGKLIALAIFVVVAMMGVVSCGASSESVVNSSLASTGEDLYQGPIYVIKRNIHYQPNGDVAYRVEYTYDDSGRVIEVKNSATSNGELQETVLSYSDFTPEGYAQVAKTAQGSESRNTYTIEDGHAVEMVSEGNNGSTTTSYTYYPSGILKTMEMQRSSDGAKSLIEYDENGYTTRNIGQQEITFDWKFDSNNNPTGYARTIGDVVDNYDVKCDEDGNIASVLDDSGALVAEFTYEIIEQPCNNAWIGAHMLQI